MKNQSGFASIVGILITLLLTGLVISHFLDSDKTGNQEDTNILNAVEKAENVVDELESKYRERI